MNRKNQNPDLCAFRSSDSPVTKMEQIESGERHIRCERCGGLMHLTSTVDETRFFIGWKCGKCGGVIIEQLILYITREVQDSSHDRNK